MNMYTTPHQPAGRLVPIFSADEDDPASHIALSLAKAAARRGETVLIVDCLDGMLMETAGIIVGQTLEHVLLENAKMRDCQYVTSNEHFTAMSAGNLKLGSVIGTLAALSLSYDWVFVATEGGCTPSHVRLAGGADHAVLTYDTTVDRFMRAYWMIDAVRRRYPKFDPQIISRGDAENAVETALTLTGLVSEFLGGQIPYGGHETDHAIEDRLLTRLSSGMVILEREYMQEFDGLHKKTEKLATEFQI